MFQYDIVRFQMYFASHYVVYFGLIHVIVEFVFFEVSHDFVTHISAVKLKIKDIMNHKLRKCCIWLQNLGIVITLC